MFDIHSCSGSPKIGGRHVEINGTPQRRVILQIGQNHSHYTRYKGDTAAYLNEYFSCSKTPVKRPYGCWRTKEGIPWCSGTREDIPEIVISIPIIMTLEITGNDDSDDTPWNFSPTIIPLDETAAKDHDIIYDLVGYAVLTSERTHFTAKYISGNNGNKTVYTYDGRKNNGRPVRINVDNLNSDVNTGEEIYQAFYYLRGGVKAQDMFVKLRAKELSQKYPLHFGNTDLSSPISITYNSQDLNAMDPKERAWMVDPYNTKMTEYISTAAKPREQSSPVKIIESEDEVPYTTPRNKSPAEDNVPRTTPCNKSPRSDASIPDSPFDVKCRCGVRGDGNKHYDAREVGAAIQCDNCKVWSHIACQREGRASNLAESGTFLCDICDLRTTAAALFGRPVSEK